MYELNIFKEKLHERAFSKKVSRACLVLYVLFGVIFGALALRMVSYASSFSRDTKKIAGYQQEIDAQRKAHDISRLESEWSGHALQLRRISAITQNRTSWAEAMRELADIVPPGVCLRSIGVKTDNNVHSLIMEVLIAARDKSGYEITDMFMSALKKSSLLSGEMRLVSQERTRIEDRELEVVRIAISIPVK